MRASFERFTIKSVASTSGARREDEGEEDEEDVDVGETCRRESEPRRTPTKFLLAVERRRVSRWTGCPSSSTMENPRSAM